MLQNKKGCGKAKRSYGVSKCHFSHHLQSFDLKEMKQESLKGALSSSLLCIHTQLGLAKFAKPNTAAVFWDVCTVKQQFLLDLEKKTTNAGRNKVILVMEKSIFSDRAKRNGG